MAKIALVTGGMGGIGTAVCKGLAAAGHKVIATYYLNPAKLEEAHAQANAWVAAMKSEGYDIAVYPCDVSDYASCEAMVAKIKAEVGSIEILINNAGITRDGMFKKLTKDKWDAVMRTNLDSLFNMTKQVIDDMMEKGWGRVINISSINGQKGQIGQTNYSAAKAGVHGFTKALAQEVARKGVTVNTIAPGYIATDMVMAIDEEIRNKIIAGIPMGRLGKPEEIAGLVCYLASDISGFMTGAELAINGCQHTM
jgi:acetoacetyl-CoA reductase